MTDITTSRESRMLSKDIEKKYKRAKNEQLNKKCVQIETLQDIDMTGIYKKIIEIAE